MFQDLKVRSVFMLSCQWTNSEKIPTAAIVENMAHFDCIHGHRHYPFGPGHLEQLSKSYKIPHSCTLPILADQSAHSDAGRPIVLDELADPEIRETYSELAQNVRLGPINKAGFNSAISRSRRNSFGSDTRLLQCPSCFTIPLVKES